MNKQEESVTAQNQRRLREAAERILHGEPVKSHRETTMTALADESGLPRTYLYRSEYKSIAEEFRLEALRLKETSQTPDEHQAQLDKLSEALSSAQRQTKERNAQLREARESIKRAASQIAFLSEQNRRLREEIHQVRNVAVLQ
ncbi:hypothetical protein ACLRGF_05665 [Mycetocola zhadangensis]|uniref:hypothetical protein n=1 Tax=Mycetocola zhadangensis TaxID=1164595 RepID=UPI003A4E647C